MIPPRRFRWRFHKSCFVFVFFLISFILQTCLPMKGFVFWAQQKSDRNWPCTFKRIYEIWVLYCLRGRTKISGVSPPRSFSSQDDFLCSISAQTKSLDTFVCVSALWKWKYIIDCGFQLWKLCIFFMNFVWTLICFG